VDRRLHRAGCRETAGPGHRVACGAAGERGPAEADGLFGTTEEWRYYNALYYCCVLGLRPYDRRRVRTDGLDRDARRALDWFRRYVPRRHMRQWQREGAPDGRRSAVE
jgi:hypothetical protein